MGDSLCNSYINTGRNPQLYSRKRFHIFINFILTFSLPDTFIFHKMSGFHSMTIQELEAEMRKRESIIRERESFQAQLNQCVSLAEQLLAAIKSNGRDTNNGGSTLTSSQQDRSGETSFSTGDNSYYSRYSGADTSDVSSTLAQCRFVIDDTTTFTTGAGTGTNSTET